MGVSFFIDNDTTIKIFTFLHISRLEYTNLVKIGEDCENNCFQSDSSHKIRAHVGHSHRQILKQSFVKRYSTYSDIRDNQHKETT